MTINKKRILTLEIAKKMAAAVEKKAEELKLKITLSIIDEGGNLKYFQRMDGASYGSVRISQLKANTSASIPLSTRALGERNAKLPNGPYGAIPDVILLLGGLPIITAEGEHLGGIGVSGATSEQDEICAQAGLDAIKEDLSA